MGRRFASHQWAINHFYLDSQNYEKHITVSSKVVQEYRVCYSKE